MTSAHQTTFPAPHGTSLGRTSVTERRPAEATLRPIGVPELAVATLLEQPDMQSLLPSVHDFAASIGAPLDLRGIAADLARGGTVGRIGVPQAATAMMLQQRVVIGATRGGDPLAPVARLWRGLQRRAGVLVDVRQCCTMPGSAAHRAGVERDVVLFSLRVLERSAARRLPTDAADSADHWTRARQGAELAYRLAMADNRSVLLVHQVGRGTEGQQFFGDALERQARQHRLPAPRSVKAGLLSALLTGESGRERWLVVSAMSIDELSATACEAIGDTGPWPVVSLGRDATFYDMPSSTSGAATPLPMLLVLADLLRRAGRTDAARLLMESITLTTAALTRMREELGAPLEVPADAFLRGVLTNWGRLPLTLAPRDRRSVDRDVQVVSGLRLRMETTLTSAALRDAVSAALMPAGLEVASVRSLDAAPARATAEFEVRVRSRLGEPPLTDEAAHALVGVLGPSLRCLGVEPWPAGAASDRSRARTS